MVGFLRRSTLWIILLGVGFASAGLKLELASFKVVKRADASGKLVEQLVPAAEVAPGDVLEWVLTAENASDRVLHQVALTIPIPSSTTYIAGSAKPLLLKRATQLIRVTPLFSYDGEHFASPPLKKKVRVQENGRIVEKEVVVPPSAYTHVRWVVPELLSKERVQVRLRTRVR